MPGVDLFSETLENAESPSLSALQMLVDIGREIILITVKNLALNTPAASRVVIDGALYNSHASVRWKS